MSQIPQNAAVLAYMREFGSITAKEAVAALSCYRLSARIYDLKRAGHNVVAERVDSGNGGQFARYWVAK